MTILYCDICGTSYPETEDCCPVCGYSRALTEETPYSSHTHSVSEKVRGGRYSKKNVLKRMKMQEEQETENQRAEELKRSLDAFAAEAAAEKAEAVEDSIAEAEVEVPAAVQTATEPDQQEVVQEVPVWNDLIEAMVDEELASAEEEPQAEAEAESIPDAPEMEQVTAALESLPSVAMDIEEVAKNAGNARGANMVLLGMAARYLQILTPDQLCDAIRTIFARKGEAVVEANIKAFQAGYGE